MVAQVLHESGHRVTGTDQMHPGRVPYEFRVADLLRYDVPYGLMEGCEGVVHLANHPNAGRMFSQRLYAENTSITMNVFQAAQETGVASVVYASSIQVVSGEDANGGLSENVPAYLPIDGNLPHAANNIYSQTKVAGEALLAFQVDHGIRLGVALRFPHIVDNNATRWRKFIFAEIAAGNRDGRLSIGSLAYLFKEDAARLVDGILRSEASGFHVLLPAAAGNKAGLSCARLRERFFPQVPLRVAPEDFTSLVDLRAIHAIVPGWTPEMEMEPPTDTLPPQK